MAVLKVCSPPSGASWQCTEKTTLAVHTARPLAAQEPVHVKETSSTQQVVRNVALQSTKARRQTVGQDMAREGPEIRREIRRHSFWGVSSSGFVAYRSIGFGFLGFFRVFRVFSV